MLPIIEVCVDSLQAAEVAVQAGADRIEINSQLARDGLTPDFQHCDTYKQSYCVPLIAMLRPHADSFVYSATDRTLIRADLERLLQCNVDGFAFGALTADNELDVDLMGHIRALSQGRELVMHRAFDLLADQFKGLDQLIELGVDRVLTSGGAKTAEFGIKQLQKLVVYSRDRIEILPGAGIHLHNAQRIVSETGCRQIHGTFRTASPGPVCPDKVAIQRLKALFMDLHANAVPDATQAIDR